MQRPKSVEWPTLGLIIVCYGSFGLLTWYYSTLSSWITIPLLVYVIALQASIQHEVSHGHPTPWGWLNDGLMLANFWLIIPFHRYRQTHLRHHQDEHLTDPLDDPESYYLDEAHWRGKPLVNRWLLTANNTLLGRLVLGPALTSYVFYRCELQALLRGSAHHWRAWGFHVVAVALVLTWVVGVCQIPLWHYLLFLVYPGVSLSLVRSFLEHQAAEEVDHRTVLIEASPFWSLLFLNNNLHLVHHKLPGMAWYKLPAAYAANRQAWHQQNAGYVLPGYRSLLRYAFRPKEPVMHPLRRRLPQGTAAPADGAGATSLTTAPAGLTTPPAVAMAPKSD